MNLKEKFNLIPDFIKNLEQGDTVYILDTHNLREMCFNNLDIQEEYAVLEVYCKDSSLFGGKIIHSYYIEYTKENKPFCYLGDEYGIKYLFADLKEQNAILEDLNKRMKENFKPKNGNN